jgi:RHS repeat-associated protein
LTPAATGFWTRYTYDVLNDLTGVTQNAQSSSTQTRSYSYDGLSRLLSEANPESGTASYVYDSSSTCSANSYNGDLVKRTDAVGNVACYGHDSLHRTTTVTYPSGSYAGVTPSKTFVYDSATVSGAAMANAKGRLAEAYTCTGSCTSKITDLGFSYSPRGEVAAAYESTPNSNGYYLTTATYWANGLLDVLNLENGAGTVNFIPAITYTPEGEGRVYSVGASGQNQNPVSSTSYNPYATPPNPNVLVTLGSGDSDAFNCDLNTGRMTSQQFNVGAKSIQGVLTWNPNGTLGQLAVTDPIAGNQTCSYTYDDLARIASVNCPSAWVQTFGLDTFGNLSKTANGGAAESFQPTYTTNPPTNQYSVIPGVTGPYYDANGDLLKDGTHTYTWDADGNVVSLPNDSIGLTFDALDRMVEQNRSGSYTQIVYGPSGGKLALMNGQTLAKGFVPLSAGATAVYTRNGSSTVLSYYRHADWLGSSRLASTPSQSVYYDGAYAPYGENYAEIGTIDRNFTGQNQDTISSGPYPLYDFLDREYHPTQGRWLSPDPLGGDITDPQSLNRYPYVMDNPTSFVDPLGLLAALGTDPAGYPGLLNCPDDMDACFTIWLPMGGWGGESGGGGGGLGSGPLSGDFGPMGYPSAGGWRPPCDFGTCSGPGPNPYVADVVVSGGEFHIYVNVLEFLGLLPGLQALYNAGVRASTVASPWAPVAWYGTSAAVALLPALPSGAKAFWDWAALNPIAWRCAISFGSNVLSPPSPWVETDEYQCGTAGQMVSQGIWWISHANGR